MDWTNLSFDNIVINPLSQALFGKVIIFGTSVATLITIALVIKSFHQGPLDLINGTRKTGKLLSTMTKHITRTANSVPAIRLALMMVSTVAIVIAQIMSIVLLVIGGSILSLLFDGEKVEYLVFVATSANADVFSPEFLQYLLQLDAVSSIYVAAGAMALIRSYLFQKNGLDTVLRLIVIGPFALVAFVGILWLLMIFCIMVLFCMLFLITCAVEWLTSTNIEHTNFDITGGLSGLPEAVLIVMGVTFACLTYVFAHTRAYVGAEVVKKNLGVTKGID